MRQALNGTTVSITSVRTTQGCESLERNHAAQRAFIPRSIRFFVAARRSCAEAPETTVGDRDKFSPKTRPTGCALAAPPPIKGSHIVADIDAEKRTISLDAKRRPLQARVGR